MHIGPMKSGTSYLQHLMAENRRQLGADGIFFPPREETVDAVVDVMRAAVPKQLKTGPWPALRERVHGFGGRASVVSMEFLSFARTPRAKAILGALEPARVHVVLGVRDAAAVLPSAWGTAAGSRNTASWREYVEPVSWEPRRREERWRRTMRALNIPRMLNAWGSQVPPRRLHVVVVPPANAPPDVLWKRFAAVIGVDAAAYRPPTGRRNESLGYAATDLLRRMNPLVHEVAPEAYRATMNPLRHHVLSRRTDESEVPMTAELADWAVSWNRSTVQAVKRYRARVYGDLDELLETPAASTDREIQPPNDDALLAAAADALTGLRQLADLRSRQLSENLISVGDDASRSHLALWAERPEPVTSAVADVAAAFCAAARLSPSGVGVTQRTPSP